MPISQAQASSLTEYVQVAASYIDQWSHPETGEVSPWYRGQKDADWDLVPGEYRYPQINPDEVRSEFTLKASSLLAHAPTTDWEWYFIMQHYGIPTRLLDWTTGSMIALHFALCHDTGVQHSAVWVLDPWSLNQWGNKSPDLLLSGEKQAAKYLPPVYSGTSLPARPVAIVPPYNSPRITVQRGAFTVHGSSTLPLNHQFTRRLAKITVPADSAHRLRRELRNAGISEFTLFPELEGLSRDIRAQQVEGC